MSNFKVVRNVTVVNTRVVTPARRDFGDQYTILVSGDGIEEVGGRSTDGGKTFWLNTNATYPNGDTIAPPKVINRSKQAIDSELGEGSEVELAFTVATTPKGTYYNLAAIKVLRMVKPVDVLDAFDDVAEATSAIDAF